VLINAGHHANEPSSTNASLRLADQLSGDGPLRARLARQNVVLIPLENVDGAALTHELAREHPQWMLHAGRFNALGFEFRAAYEDAEHPSTDSRALPGLWAQWLPEIYIDAHGCPSHEWLQYFTGYVPVWPAYWLPRAMFMAYLRHPPAAAYPGHADLALGLQARIEAAIGEHEDIRTVNAQYAESYRRYATRWAPDAFPLAESPAGVIYRSEAEVGEGDWANWSTDFMSRYPAITSVSMVTEIPDETVVGDSMEICVRTQLVAGTAAVELLDEWDGRLERVVREHDAGCRRLAVRPRPLGRRASD
jgi:hypothetical protein